MQSENQEHYKYWGLTGTVFWGLVLIFVFIASELGTLFLAVVAIELKLITFMPGLTPEQYIYALTRNGTANGVAIIVACLVVVPLAIGIIKLKSGTSIRDYLALNTPERKSIFFGCLFIMISISIGFFISIALGRPLVPESIKTLYLSAQPYWIFFIAVVFAAAISEEVIFRGFLHTGLEKAGTGLLTTVLLPTLIWTIMHVQYDLILLAQIFVIGITMGLFRIYTNSLYVPLAMHMFNNFIAIIATGYLI